MLNLPSGTVLDGTVEVGACGWNLGSRDFEFEWHLYLGFFSCRSFQLSQNIDPW